jgi:hypothetical protein
VADQRIAKVIGLLTGEPDQPANDRAPEAGSLINGPRLDRAAGCVTQDDVDALFGYNPASA